MLVVFFFVCLFLKKLLNFYESSSTVLEKCTGGQNILKNIRSKTSPNCLKKYSWYIKTVHELCSGPNHDSLEIHRPEQTV